MVDFDRFAEILDEQAALLPPAVFHALNLGVGVVVRAKRSRLKGGDRPLYTLGEYRVHPVMGRGILLYYGSFCRAFPQLEEDAMRLEIDRVLKHELTHHLENRAGSRDLELEDEQQLARFRQEEDI